MPQAYSPSGFLDKYPAIRKRFLESVVQNVAPTSQIRTREETNSVGLVPPPEGAADDLLDWYDRLVEDAEEVLEDKSHMLFETSSGHILIPYKKLKKSTISFEKLWRK
jgi:hypothetical protein